MAGPFGGGVAPASGGAPRPAASTASLAVWAGEGGGAGSGGPEAAVPRGAGGPVGVVAAGGEEVDRALDRDPDDAGAAVDPGVGAELGELLGLEPVVLGD